MNNEEQDKLVQNQPVLVPYANSDSTYCSSEIDFNGIDSDGSWVMPMSKKVKRLFKSPQDTDSASTSTASSTVLRTFFETYSSSTDTESNDGIGDDDEIVGKKGFRKKRPLPKRLQAKSERWSGKGKKVQPNPCAGKKCGNKCEMNFSDEDRTNIHELYWGLGSSVRQRDWLLALVEETNVRRRRIECGSRRSVSYRYYFPWGDGGKKKVCQQFLLKTLGISQMTLRYTLKNITAMNVSKPDERGKSTPSNKYSESAIQEVKKFIQKLPAVKSHYCRNKGNKLYLPSEFRNLSFLYNKVYLQDEIVKETGSVQKQTFKNIFRNDYNIGFHLPKKDKCEMCERIKNLDSTTQNDAMNTEEYKKHVQEKNAAKNKFLNDQARSRNSSDFLCASFDLEKVLTTPHGDSINLYYSRKLAYFNETIYESGSRNGYCYLWHESEAKRGCNEVCTVVFKYLKMIDEKGEHSSLALYCDSCCGQNKNRAMLSMLSYFISNVAIFIENITINFLVPGHTMMPVDSVHATIESFIKGRTVWAPSQWPTLISNARTNPKNYETIMLDNADVLDWKSFADLYLPKSIKIPVTKLRSACFQKVDPKKMLLSYGFCTDSENQCVDLSFLIRSRQSRQRLQAPMVAYSAKIPIAKPKYMDLKKMCDKGIIPAQFVQEYLALPYDGNTRDLLPEESDEE